MDELKTRIWDYLYRAGQPQQIDVIAAQVDETQTAVQEAVDDPWFEESDGYVAIARTEH